MHVDNFIIWFVLMTSCIKRKDIRYCIRMENEEDISKSGWKDE
jgi:hypothetical protein